MALVRLEVVYVVMLFKAVTVPVMTQRHKRTQIIRARAANVGGNVVCGDTAA